MRAFTYSAVFAALLTFAAPASAQVSVGVTIGRPPAPQAYRVPARPGPDYFWVEGYGTRKANTTSGMTAIGHVRLLPAPTGCSRTTTAAATIRGIGRTAAATSITITGGTTITIVETTIETIITTAITTTVTASAWCRHAP